ncbi:hypothetical protein DOY81_008849 [Sarcophaga bullata]|nr:hypothetical protein DOY81_008849 [Sarcophaga bullata]
MNPLDQSEHLLALKEFSYVMLYFEIFSDAFNTAHFGLPTAPNYFLLTAKLSLKQVFESEGTSIAGSEFLAAGQFMLLPQSFGNIYLGETFSSYICVHNCTSHTVEGVTVKADLQSNNTRINLPMHENKAKPAALGPDETLDDVIRYEVKEIGTHILVCEVNYITPAGLAQYFRKFFKFRVLKPLDVKTKFYNAEMDEIYLEAQIQNITTGPFCLEKVELDSSDQYTVRHSIPCLMGSQYSPPKICCNQAIAPKPEVAKDIKALRIANTVGKLDIVWRSNLGEKGRLQTSQLQRLPFEYKDIRLEVVDAKNIVKIGEPFTFSCRVANTADRPMDLIVKLPTPLDFNCPYTGGAEFRIGAIDPGQHAEFPLTVCPSKLGLIKISPLILRNTLMQEQYTIEKVVDVFVVDSDYHDDESFQINKFVRYDNAPHQQVEDQSLQLQVV